jgi:hypothetical protein
MRTWIDDDLVLEENSMLWRKYNNVSINMFYISTFFGGSDETWISEKDQVREYLRPRSWLAACYSRLCYLTVSNFATTSQVAVRGTRVRLLFHVGR